MDPRDAGHGEAALSRLIYTKGTWTMSVPTSRPAIDNRQRHPDVPDELSEFLVRAHKQSAVSCALRNIAKTLRLCLQKRARLQVFEGELRGLGAESIEDLKEFAVPQLREMGFTKLQVEKIGKEIARTSANADQKKKRQAAEVRFYPQFRQCFDSSRHASRPGLLTHQSVDLQAPEVPATVEGVASALSTLRTTQSDLDLTQPLATIPLVREEDQWDEFAALVRFSGSLFDASSRRVGTLTHALGVCVYSCWRTRRIYT